MNSACDVVVVGGGPAGLAAAIASASRGFDTVVLERHADLPDKACGEGLLPRGVAALHSLDALSLVKEGAYFPLHAIRYVQEDGSYAQASLTPPGMGIRRLVLARALATRAERAGATLLFGRRALGHERVPRGIAVHTNEGSVVGRLLVAADGLHSAIRRQAGFEKEVPDAPERFGMRRHFRIAPWGPRVEVYLSEEVEAYVTPVSFDQVGVAVLWEQGRVQGPVSYERLLARFPELQERLRAATPCTKVLGSGPLAQAVTGCVADRLLLLGDAAGYVDAITGEGLSMAFECAALLGGMLAEIVRNGATTGALDGYARALRHRYRRYEIGTRAVLYAVRHPRLRRRALGVLATRPEAFSHLVRWALGPCAPIPS